MAAGCPIQPLSMLRIPSRGGETGREKDRKRKRESGREKKGREERMRERERKTPGCGRRCCRCTVAPSSSSLHPVPLPRSGMYRPLPGLPPPRVIAFRSADRKRYRCEKIARNRFKRPVAPIERGAHSAPTTFASSRRNLPGRGFI